LELNEVAPPGFGHTKSGKGDKKGGTAAAFDRARKEGRFKGSKSDMFAIMWSQKNKGDKPHYKPGTDEKYKKYQKEELTGDMKTDLEKYRVPRGPGGNPIRMGDKVRSMKGDQPLGKLKVKYGADKVREYYKKNKAVGESAVLDANKKLETQAWRKKKQKEYAKLIAIYNHQKNLQQRGLGSPTKRKQTSESFEIDKSAHKKAQRQSKIRNLAKDNKNPNEKAAAERKLKGPKLAWEEFKKHI